MGRSTAKLAADEQSAKLYLPGGRAPKAGEMFRNPELAASLRLVAEKGAAGFYDGKPADAILAVSRQLGGTMTAEDLRQFRPEWVDPISTTYRGWTVSELPPNTAGIAALMMLNLMEQYPLAQYGLHSPRAMHVMIEAKKLAYADMLRYVADPRFGARAGGSPAQQGPREGSRAPDRSGAGRMRRQARRARRADQLGRRRHDLSDRHRQGRQHRLADSEPVFELRQRRRAAGNRLHAAQPRRAVHAQADHPNVLAPRKRPLHTIIPGFMEKGDVRIGFGIMGGFNQAQAHAQFVADIADYGLDIQQALDAGRFTKLTFPGCDVSVESMVPQATRARLQELGHDVTVIQPRTGSTVGYGQAVMSDGAGVHFGASEPRHDGAAIPEAPPVFPRP